eukprot:scaffold102676_cov31-Tisochrysis_lutea.AAC.8
MSEAATRPRRQPRHTDKRRRQPWRRRRARERGNSSRGARSRDRNRGLTQPKRSVHAKAGASWLMLP